MSLRLAGRPLGLSFLSSAAAQGLNVFTGVLLARALGPHDRGALAAVILWPSILAALGNLGVSDAVTYHAARRREPVGTIVGSAVALGLVQSAIACGIGVAVLPLALGHQFGDAIVSDALLFLAFVPLSMLAMHLFSVLNGLHRFAAFQALRLVPYAAPAIGLGALAATGSLGVRSGTIVYVASSGVALVLAAALLLRGHVRPLRARAGVARELLVFGVRSHLGNVSSLVNERLDQLLISIFLAPTKLGLYVVAVTLTSLTSLVGSSVSVVALPTVAGLPEGEERTRAARRLVALTVAASAAVTLPLIVLAPWLIELFFGRAYSGAAGVARILLVAAVVLSTNRALGAVLTGAGRPLLAGSAELTAVAVTFVALAALLPTLGLVGAGLASLLAYAVSLAWLLRGAGRALQLGLRDLLLPGASRP